ncbi:hypothetical protein NQ318_010563 [Aromia moschata]|uniref:Uncharacterized protein n=1 Tax=Aromia moschata TaxID=1265417 RepID=A0AAV8XBZ5_9CUCU|nr:hypothetical protein NQ318_010563 [Aromia moschata]
MYSREDVVKLLLTKKGVDPYSTGGSRNQTAVHLVASRQTGTATAILRALLQAAGKDIRLKPDGRGKIPLLLAVEAGNQSMCRELLSSQTAEQLKAQSANGDTALHLAVRRKDIDMVRILVDYGTSVDIRNGEGQTPLHIAAAEGDEVLVKYFYGVRASASITDNQDRTPMHLAAENGHANIIELLADKFKASILERTKDGSTLMHIASLNGHADCAMMLFKKGVYLHMPNKNRKLNLSTETDALAPRNLEILLPYSPFGPDYFGLEKTVDQLYKPPKAVSNTVWLPKEVILKKTILNCNSIIWILVFEDAKHGGGVEDGARSIHTAARYGHVGIINTLLQKGEKVDVTTNDNYTALHIAVESCKPAVVETLLGYGADVHVRGGKLKETALHIAARVKDGEKCALMLLKSGAGPNLATHDGQTPVHVAARYGNLQTLLLLLEDGGDPQFKNKKGETPLHLASRGCRPDVVKHLISYVKEHKGEDKSTLYVNEVNENDESALHYVCTVNKDEVETPNSDREVVKLLLENGADVKLQTKQHDSAFHYVALAGNNDVLMEMIGHMSSTDAQKALNRQNVNGWTPLLIASHKGHLDLVNNLLANHARVDVFDNEGRSALHLAAEQGYLPVCDSLLTNKAFINSKSRNGRTALHLAAMNGYIHLVKFLIKDHNAVIDILTLKKQTPLHLAAGAGQIEVCKLLLELGADIDATDEQGQKPIHAACQNNFSEVAKLFLQQHPSLVMATTKDGNTCAHIAAAQGSVTVIEELMKFDRQGVISARNKITDATPLQMAAEGGHAEVVKALVRAGASVTDENKSGFTAVHLAAQYGHMQFCVKLDKSAAETIPMLKKAFDVDCLSGRQIFRWHRAFAEGREDVNDENRAGRPSTSSSDDNVKRVLEVLRSSNTLRVTSKKLGVTPLHVAAYFGQADTVRELLTHVPGTVKSDSPNGASLVPALGNESGMTPLHLAAFSGNENVVRLLLNSAGVQVDASTHENGYNSMHLACYGGHVTVVGLLLSRSAELLQSVDKHGKTGLHIAAQHGHYQMVEVLLGQGAEINASDRNGWTPLHCAARAGCFEVVKLLVESGASPKSETNLGAVPIWFAASEGHHAVLEYLMTKEHDTYALMEDRRFVYNLMVCGKNHNNKPIEEFILVSPAPVDTAAKLSNILIVLSNKEKERAKDLIAAGKFCEAMATELLALAAGADSAGKILTSTDRRNVEFLDVLIENEQKEVIAHTVVQRYLQFTMETEKDGVLPFLDVLGKRTNNNKLAHGVYRKKTHTDRYLNAASHHHPQQKRSLIKTLVHRAETMCDDESRPEELKQIKEALTKNGYKGKYIDRVCRTQRTRIEQQPTTYACLPYSAGELWRGALNWAAWRTLLLFVFFIICPPVWIAFTLPLGHKYYKVPIIKFMSYLTSHIYLMLFLLIVGITPPYPVVRNGLFPFWYEWILLVWLSGLLLFELTNPSDKSGLGWIKLSVLLFSIFGVGVHLMGILFINPESWATLMYCRNQLFALSFVLACVQILDFLSFHHLFGPWAIIIGNLMKDLARFLAVLAIFVFGFSMQFVALNQPFNSVLTQQDLNELRNPRGDGTLSRDRGYFSAVRESLTDDAEWIDEISGTQLLARARKKDNPLQGGCYLLALMFPVVMNPPVGVRAVVFRRIRPDHLRRTDDEATQGAVPFRPAWTDNLFKVVFGVYMLVSVVVLINLLIAMMSDTYQRIQTTTDHLRTTTYQTNPQATTRYSKPPPWTEALFKCVFGVYMLVSVVVLINLLIAMMTDTYQRIQVTDR